MFFGLNSIHDLNASPISNGSIRFGAVVNNTVHQLSPINTRKSIAVRIGTVFAKILRVGRQDHKNYGGKEMKSTHFRGVLGAVILGVALLAGIGAAPSTAQAQYGRYERDFYRMAQHQGYRDGVWEGENRSRSGRSYDPYGTHSYKKATDGYNSRMGPKSEYQRAYREGYLRGYNEGFRRYDRRGRRY